MNNKIFFFPNQNKIGCIGLLLAILVISIVLFFSFFFGIIILGCLGLYFVYIKYLKNFFFKSESNNREKKFTDAEYIELDKDDLNDK